MWMPHLLHQVSSHEKSIIALYICSTGAAAAVARCVLLLLHRLLNGYQVFSGLHSSQGMQRHRASFMCLATQHATLHAIITQAAAQNSTIDLKSAQYNSMKSSRKQQLQFSIYVSAPVTCSMCGLGCGTTSCSWPVPSRDK
jgi:opacity protein-like surface antigen